jgi:hypothetical protein
LLASIKKKEKIIVIMNQYYAGKAVSGKQTGVMAGAVLAEQEKSPCVALLWLKGTPSEVEKREVLRVLNNIEGVLGLKFMREEPTVMMVDYCGKAVKVEYLVKKVAASGSEIRRVGC